MLGGNSNSNLYRNILIVGLLLSLCTVCYSFFTFGLTNIHSDNAVELLAIRSIFENKDIFPNGWVYCNGDINLMRIQIFILFPYLLFKDWSIARECGALLVSLLSCGSIILLNRRMLKNDSWLISIPVFLLFISGVISRDVSMYSGMYTSIMLYTNILIVLFYKIYCGNGRNKIVLITSYFFLMLLLLIGGVRWIAEMTLPMMGTIICMSLWRFIENTDDTLQKCIKKIFILTAYIVIPSVLGILIYYHVKEKCFFFVNSQDSIVLSKSISDILSNTIQVVKNIYKCLGYTRGISILSLTGLRNVTTLVIGTVFCMIVPILQLVRLNTESTENRFFLLYAYMHNLILLAATILLGKLVEYHVITIIFVNILISGRYVWVYWMDKHKGALVCTLLMLGIFIQSLFMLSRSVGWKDRYIRERSVVQTILDHGVTKGYGGFWTAYNNELYSNGAIQMGAIRFGDNYFETYNCLCDTTVFEDSMMPSCLIFTEDELVQYGDKALELFGPTLFDWEIESVPVYNHYNYTWDDKKIIIWAWDYDIASALNNGVMDGRLLPGELIFNWCGTKTSDAIIMANGGIVNGPYSTIYKGEYLVNIIGENLGSISYNVSSVNYENAISYREISREDNNICFELNVNESIDDVNFSFKNDGIDNITFNCISLSKQ